MQWGLKQNSRSGFTIVELLIVVVVIAILAAITIVAYNGIQNRAKQSAAQSAVSQASKKVLAYAVDNADQYPPDLAAAGITNTTGLQYSYNNSVTPRTYGITATNGAFSYYISSASPQVTAGGYSGHSQGGVAAIKNLITNPSFEAGASGWSPSGNITLSHQASGGLYGAAFHRGTRTSTAAIGIYSPQFAIESGETYTGRMSARYITNQAANLRFQWYNSSGTVLTPSTGSTSASANGSAWQTLTYTATAPADAVAARFDIVLGTTGSAAGDNLDIDGSMVVKGANAYGYADGNTAAWAWDGAVNASSSTGPPTQL